ncbi:hypothetical protein XCR_1174 [Xanthomonas campestris pv. raphani 756C]|nr:hypothetical protein XCR_1174 [Xanthomonas campestris pv. raphani 756C]
MHGGSISRIAQGREDIRPARPCQFFQQFQASATQDGWIDSSGRRSST